MNYSRWMRTSIPVLFEDASLVAVDKPSGVLSAPDRYDPDEPVAATLLEGRWPRLWPVHRLDKDTSGVLLFALSEDTHRALSEAFEQGLVRKTYRAIVRGRPAWNETACELPLLPDGDRQHRTIIDAANGKPSRTEFAVLETYGPYSLVEARPSTGRTHQIRVHLAALGLPIACDPLYGDGKPLLLSRVKRRWKGDPRDERPLMSRTALHALKIEFAHPLKKESLAIEAPYPKDFRAATIQFGKA